MDETILWFLSQFFKDDNLSILSKSEDCKKDCSYYWEDFDMGKHIPVCNRYNLYGNFSCEKCIHYNSKYY